MQRHSMQSAECRHVALADPSRGFRRNFEELPDETLIAEHRKCAAYGTKCWSQLWPSAVATASAKTPKSC